MMKPGGEQLGCSTALGEGVRKFHAPRPRLAGGGGFWFDDPGRAAIGLEFVALEAVPVVDRLAGEGNPGLRLT
jgi:hypothetical protein